MDARDCYGQTALHHAARGGHEPAHCAVRVGFRTTKRRRRGCHTTFAPVATAPLSVGGARRVSSSSAPASLVASPVPPSERPVGILPGRRGRGQIELLIAGMAVSMAVFAPVIAPAAVAAFMFTRRDAQGRRGQLAVGTRTRRECARTVEPGAGAPAEWAGAGEGSDAMAADMGGDLLSFPLLPTKYTSPPPLPLFPPCACATYTLAR